MEDYGNSTPRLYRRFKRWTTPTETQPTSRRHEPYITRVQDRPDVLSDSRRDSNSSPPRVRTWSSGSMQRKSDSCRPRVGVDCVPIWGSVTRRYTDVTPTTSRPWGTWGYSHQWLGVLVGDRTQGTGRGRHREQGLLPELCGLALLDDSVGQEARTYRPHEHGKDSSQH